MSVCLHLHDSHWDLIPILIQLSEWLLVIDYRPHIFHHVVLHDHVVERREYYVFLSPLVSNSVLHYDVSEHVSRFRFTTDSFLYLGPVYSHARSTRRVCIPSWVKLVFGKALKRYICSVQLLPSIELVKRFKPLVCHRLPSVVNNVIEELRSLTHLRRIKLLDDFLRSFRRHTRAVE